MSSAVDSEDSDEEEMKGLSAQELNIKITKKYSTEEGYDEKTKSYTCRQCGSQIKTNSAGRKNYFTNHVKNSHEDWEVKLKSPDEIVYQHRVFLPFMSEVFNRPQDDEQFDDKDFTYYGGVGGPLGVHVEVLKKASDEREVKLAVNEQVQKDFDEFLGFEHKKL